MNKLGPGLITGASDDDPSGIATYSQAGAMFGLGLLWTALITYPLMYAVQEMCARIGIVCECGLAGVIKKHYSKKLIYGISLIVLPAIVVNIAADIAGMGAVVNMLVPEIPAFFADIVITVAILASLILFSYNRIALILKYFCLALFCYFIVPFLVKQNWSEVLIYTFLPKFQLTNEYITMLVAVLGTTISPYLFFWQANMSLENKNQSTQSDGKEIKDMKTDVNSGMLLSNLTMYFIILTTGSVLFSNGVKKIDTVQEAAQALKPLAGEFAYLLFTLGILGVGFLALPVLAGSIGYVFAETFGWHKGLDKKFHEAKEFYIVIGATLLLGLIINAFGIDPIGSLIFAAVVYGVIAPIVIAVILFICNNKKIMGEHTNSLTLNILGFLALILMGVAAIVLLASLFY